MTPKVSVIVPIYNAEKYLKECLNSIVSQTLPNMQIVLVDDGSTDSSAEICEEYVEKYNEIEYYYKENGGTASARNLGLIHAKGEYIGFVDSDDFIEPNMFLEMYNEAYKNDCDILFCYMPGLADYVYLEPGEYNYEEIKKVIFPRVLPYLNEAGTFRSIDYGNCSRLYRRDLIINNHIVVFEKSRYIEDLVFAFETTLYAKQYGVINKGELYHYRPVLSSKTHTYSKGMWSSLSILLQYLRELVVNYKDYDFNSALDYCIFYFATKVVKNELLNPQRSEAKTNIEKVITDPFVVEAINSITSEKMNNDYSQMYSYMRKQDTNSLWHFVKKYHFRRKYLVPIGKRIFSNKRILRLYKKIRGK